MLIITQTALELGFLYALIAMALFLSYRILDIADLTTDGCFVLGAAVSVTVTAAGHPILAIFAAMLAGACAGFVTAFLQTKLGVPSILAGIITNTGLYTVNLMAMGWKSNQSLLGGRTEMCIRDRNATNHYRTIDFYKSFLAAHPNNHSAHLWLLDLLIADRRCAEARKVLDQMHRLKPTYNDDFYLGRILLQEGHIDDALAQWKTMCASYPDTWEVYVMRASELAKLGYYDEAIADYEKTMTLMPSPRFIDPDEAIAQICEIRGDYETAIACYEKVIELMRTDWSEMQGEAIDAPQRNIARLRERMANS